ncbi:MAG: 1-(5-phosphoribosyl)-5-[Eggerthellaceae bacterium]|nr:1-(5-phosphoribosyl)-5-[(5-phosphoribosylamino)methylideneamino]imidazole-4-carboxamide isomerase [Eggerthellaceae bacterium]
MLIFPAIDIIDGCAVRLIKGDYAQKTIYSENPVEFARAFADAGATCLHMVDLEGAKSGDTPNLDTIRAIAQESGLFTEVGGGIRSREVIEAYLNAGVGRVILGTAAVKDPAFLREAVSTYGEKIAVGVDLLDGMVAIKGWTESSGLAADAFCASLEELGVRTIICTDISKDGMLAGANRELYAHLAESFNMDIVASGGVSSIADIEALRDMGLYAAIVGKAYYEGYIDLKEAIEVAKGEVPSC